MVVQLRWLQLPVYLPPVNQQRRRRLQSCRASRRPLARLSAAALTEMVTDRGPIQPLGRRRGPRQHAGAILGAGSAASPLGRVAIGRAADGAGERARDRTERRRWSVAQWQAAAVWKDRNSMTPASRGPTSAPAARGRTRRRQQRCLLRQTLRYGAGRTPTPFRHRFRRTGIRRPTSPATRAPRHRQQPHRRAS